MYSKIRSEIYIVLFLLLMCQGFVSSDRECSNHSRNHLYSDVLSRGQMSSGMSKCNVLSKNPLIMFFRNCITTYQQLKLLNLAESRFTDDANSGFSTSLYLRNKSDASLWFLRELAMLAGNLSGLPWNLAEPVSLTKYSASQNYELHFDTEFVMKGKKMKRAATFLLYLNSVFKGGETIFPRSINESDFDPSSIPNDKPLLKEICHRDDVLKVSPEARSCLVFFNHLAEEQGGGLNRRSIHGSCPVINQEKWVAQIWLHHEPWGSGVTDFW